MADLSTIKLPNNNSYTLKDSNAIGSINFSGHILTTVKRGGGTAQIDIGTFDTISVTDLSVGDLVVTGPASFTNGLYGNLNGNATTANSATKATQDESGNNIKASYASSFSISDHTITLKNKNGTSLGTVTVPDNNTTYTFANGTNSFTVTPSGGSAQTVTVTPSITNNVISNGTTTSGYLAKFSAANTVTNGPQLGSSTATYLRNDGTWQTPYTFTSGTNGFTVTPAGGTAQTVTVTPSITNNITGSGTNNYIAKFSGANTLTNGPAIGSSTTTYLRNDGTWATPTNTWNAMTGATQSANGTVGYVNAVPPADGYNSKFLRADSTWSNIYWDNIKPTKTKTFEGVTCSGDSDPAGWLYFFKAPSTGGYYDQWHLTYKITATMAGQTDGKQISIVHIDGTRNTYMAYYTWNSINNTSYRPLYAHTWYPVKQAGLTGGYGPVFGLRFQSSYGPANSTYARTIKFEILEEKGCDVTFFNSPTLYANVSGTGSTNFEGRQAFDGTTQGVTCSGDRNDTTTLTHNTTKLTAVSNPLMQNSILMRDSSGNLQSVCVGTSGVGTGKTKNPTGFLLGEIYFYGGGHIAVGSQTGANTLRMAVDWVDFRYTSNCETNLVAYKMLYLKGSISNGLFYLDDVWWTQDLPTTNDGKVYVLIGMAYNTYCFNLWGWRGAFYHDGTILRKYIYTNATQSNHGFMSSTDKTKLDSYVLRSTTKLANDSAAGTETAGKIYPVVFDKSGYLSVNVPWVNTTALASMTGTLGVGNGGTGQTSFTNNAIITGAGSNTALKSVATANGAAYATSANGALTFGTLPVAQGGTGKTSGIDAANYFINQLSTGSSVPNDADYYISQFVNGGTTTTTYHRRPMSALWSYISGKMSKAIDGVTFNGSAAITHYGTCSTAAATAEKAVACTSWTLVTGAIIWIKFTVTNTAAVANLQLNVNSTGAKAIKYRGGNLPSVGILTANRLYGFIYDGTNFELIGDLDTDANTTYTAGTGLSLSGNQFSLATSGATAGSYGMSAATTIEQGSTVNIPYITVDTYGRITAISNKVLTLDIDELDTLTVDSLTVSNVLATGAARFTNGLFGNLTGSVTGDVTGNVTGNLTGTASMATNDSDGNAINTTYLKKSGGTMTGGITFANNVWNSVGDDVLIGDKNIGGTLCVQGKNAATGIRLIPQSSTGTAGVTWSASSATESTISGTLNGTFVGSLTGNASSATTAATATTATKFSSNRTIALTGDVTGSVSSDGTSGWSIATTVGDDSHNHTYNTIVPIETKTYTGWLGTSNNNAANDSFYFMKLRPNDWYQQWVLKYRITSYIPNKTNFYATSDITLYGYGQASAPAYRIFNTHYSTSYRPYYYHNFYRLTAAGYNANLWNAIGLGLRSSNEMATSGYERTVKVEILEATNCDYELLDTGIKWANWASNSSTNYAGLSEFDGCNNGLRETGDDNDTTTQRSYYTHFTAGTNGIKQYSIFMMDSNKKWQSFTTDSGTGTSKTKNPSGFVLGRMFYLSRSTDIAANGVNADNQVTEYINLIDFRYSSNCGTTLVANKPLYIVGAMSNGLFYLDDTWWTQTEPTTADGKVYIHIGVSYDTYRVDFMGWMGAYYHDGTNFIKYEEAAVAPYHVKKAGDTMTGNLTISNTAPSLTINNTGSGESSLILQRSGSNAADWKILNTSGNLKFQNNYTSSEGAYFDVLTLNYNTGNATFKGTITGTTITGTGVNANSGNSGTAGGISLYGTAPTQYGIALRQTASATLRTHGYVQGIWAEYNCIGASSADESRIRGWIFRNFTTDENVASISGVGNAVFNGSVTVGGNTANTSGMRMEYDATLGCTNFIFN